MPLPSILRRWVPPALLDAVREVVADTATSQASQTPQEPIQGTGAPPAASQPVQAAAGPQDGSQGAAENRNPNAPSEVLRKQVREFVETRCEPCANVIGDSVEVLYHSYFLWLRETQAKVYSDFAGFVLLLERDHGMRESFLPEDGRVRLGVRVTLGRPEPALPSMGTPGMGGMFGRSNFG